MPSLCGDSPQKLRCGKLPRSGTTKEPGCSVLHDLDDRLQIDITVLCRVILLYGQCCQHSKIGNTFSRLLPSPFLVLRSAACLHVSPQLAVSERQSIAARRGSGGATSLARCFLIGNQHRPSDDHTGQVDNNCSSLVATEPLARKTQL